MQEKLTEDQLGILMRPLNPDRISKRSQGGRSLSYLEAWDVKTTLIRLFGFGGFSSEVLESKIINHREESFEVTDKNGNTQTKWKDAISVMVTLRLTIHQLGAVYTETAASSQAGSQGFGDVADFAFKTAESDALKRAAIFLGTQFGLSLYDNGSTAEVVKTIVAPDQKFWNGQRTLPPVEEVKQGIAENNVANTAPEAQQDHPQFYPQDQAQEAPRQGAAPLSGAPLTPEQQAANQQVMDKLNRVQDGKQNG